MEQILTKSVESYFRVVHNETIDMSNAIYLLERIREFEQIHLAHKNDFKVFRGLNFESILEVVQQSKHHLEESQLLYTTKGNLLTINTKQYTIEQKNKEYIGSLIDENKLAERFVSKLMQEEKSAKSNTKITAKDLVNSQIIKDSIKSKRNT
ncbi:hypothetical protein [Sphingobacterium sp.]|uniref:hypothetical protein n=1 Tax=Sphingobacterium sp. TaxID=341027 RepID=UPI002FD9E6E5